jgi:hypothetical protein
LLTWYLHCLYLFSIFIFNVLKDILLSSIHHTFITPYPWFNRFFLCSSCRFSLIS